MGEPSVFSFEHLETPLIPWSWPFAQQRRAEIAEHFQILQRKTPTLWNGRVLLMNSCSVERQTIRGSFFETDYADFIAWRDWGFPDANVINAFAMGAIRTADGAYLLGIMAPSTVNVGQIYFPSGTPDLSDVVGREVDLAGSVIREVAEETGLGREDFEAPTAWTAVRDGSYLALMHHLEARDNADVLRARILATLARQKLPEFSNIVIVRSRADFDARMPPFVTAFLNRVLAV
jgi:hypothetical protein